jgi:hypothetical protein
MEPWKYEAGTIVYSTSLKNEIYSNSAIEDYLKVGDHDHKFILMGPKGIGKTLLINLKSKIYNEELLKKGFKVYPANSLCENLLIPNELLSKEDLLKFTNYDIWKKVWLFTLCVIACNTINIPLPKSIKDSIDNSTSCSLILTIILQNRKDLSVYISAIPKLLTLVETINSGIAIFIDNLDQALQQFLLEYHYSDIDGMKNPSVEVWANAQNGLVSTIYNLNRHNSHVKVFATIRNEAFNAYKGEMRLNFRDYCTELRYTREEIKMIYKLNVDLMKEKHYIEKEGSNHDEKFVGFKSMPHAFAKTASNRKRSENTFDFIYRHTLGRPREMVYLGRQLFENLICSPAYRTSKKSKRIEKLRWEVNNISNILFEDYLNELIPKFDKSKLISFLNIVQCNVIPSFTTKGNEELMKYFYSIGILGYISKSGHDVSNGNYVQRFLPVARYTYNTTIELPKSKYYLTHPSIDDHLKKLFDLSFYNRNNIIGDGYAFKDFKNITRKYDVALSFAGENRDYVEKVAIFLKDQGVAVFYDNHHKTSLWGKDLFQHLHIIYKELAKCCVIFISEHYPIKLWTKHELKAVQSRVFSKGDDYLLPVRFDETGIPGLSQTVGYIDARVVTPHELAEEIVDKIKTLPNID